MSSQTSIRCARPKWVQYALTILVVTMCSLLSWGVWLLNFTNANIIMIYLAGVAMVAMFFGRWPSVVAAVLSVLAFDYFFVPPHLSFAQRDWQYVVDLVVMLGIGLLISELMARLQAQLAASQLQEHRTGQLFQMTRQLSELAGLSFLVPVAGRQVAEIFSGDVVVFLRDAANQMKLQYGSGTAIANDPANLRVAQWAADQIKTVGVGTDRFPEAGTRFVPMVGSQKVIGVLGVRPRDTKCFDDPEPRRTLDTVASLIALSIERDQSFVIAQQAQHQVESEQFRNYLLSSISHDLRTPLATIAVTTSSLLEGDERETSPERREILQTVVDESHRLARQVENLLGHARLTSGTMVLNREWQVLEELVGIALTRMRSELENRSVRVNIEDDFPLLWVAGDLLERVLVNLLENAIRYTPAGTEIMISAQRCGELAEIRVADKGPGLPAADRSRVFEKFFRGTAIADGQRGIGLGLAICKAIVEAHGGHIRADDRAGGGAEFIISLPCPQQSPQATLNEFLSP